MIKDKYGTPVELGDTVVHGKCSSGSLTLHKRTVIETGPQGIKLSLIPGGKSSRWLGAGNLVVVTKADGRAV